jgi:hypothetical protein
VRGGAARATFEDVVLDAADMVRDLMLALEAKRLDDLRQ